MRAWYWRWRLRGTEPPACLGCGGELVERVLPVVIARAGSFEVRAEGVPYRSCEQGCGDRRPAVPGFEAAVLAAVTGGALPVARVSITGDWQCGRCSSREWSPVRRLSTVAGEVAVDGAAPFRLAITGPTMACGNCRTVQLRTTTLVAREVAAALHETWRAAGLRQGFRRP